MIFQDNVIKEYLKNVYFISGTACGGKTTVSRTLGEKYNIPVYDIDERFPEHQRISDPACQPCMNRRFKDADEFFGRSVEEYSDWLIRNTREQLDYVLLDLIRLSQNGRIICDCHITLDIAKSITEQSRTAFLVREPVNLIDQYCGRPDHKGFTDYIRSATDVEKAKSVCDETLCALNADFIRTVKDSGWFSVERDGTRSPEETARLVARHFGW